MSSYYEQVRDAIEQAGCTTSDAQGIIGAWEHTKYPGQDFLGDRAMEEAEQAGIAPEELAKSILDQ